MAPEAGVTPIEVHKALADDTRFRLYRYLRLSGRAVSIRELSTRLSLHPNTLRPHLRRLEDVGLVAHESRRGSTVGRPQVLYSVAEVESGDGDYRLLAEILSGLVRGKRALQQAEGMAREWGAYLMAQGAPKPGAAQPGRLGLVPGVPRCPRRLRHRGLRRVPGRLPPRSGPSAAERLAGERLCPLAARDQPGLPPGAARP
jgi:DNA-binding transcriptional ArsR family regulator